MKKVILIAACLFSLTVVNAQDVTATTPAKKAERASLTPEQRAQKQTDELNTIVVLTADQKTKVYDLALAKVKKVEEIKVKYKDSQDRNQESVELSPVRKEFQQNVKALLTPEQIEKYNTNQKEKRASGKGSPGTQD